MRVLAANHRLSGTEGWAVMGVINGLFGKDQRSTLVGLTEYVPVAGCLVDTL